MSQTNAFLKHPERSSYELAYLLRDLPRHLSYDPLTVEHQQMAEAAEMQALNYSDTLLHGLEAIGRVMWVASVNEQNEVDVRDIGHIGMLVTELAVQLQFLGEFRSEVKDSVAQRDQKEKRK